MLSALSEQKATIRRIHDENKEQLQAFRMEVSNLVSMATRFMNQYVTNIQNNRKLRKVQNGEADLAIIALYEFKKAYTALEMLHKR